MNIYTVALLASLLHPLSLSQIKHPDGMSFASTDERDFRRLATHQELPTYPNLARRNGTTGVVVAVLYLDSGHAPFRVDILEAPSQVIAESVKKALLHWTFMYPQTPNDRVPLAGKVTFYFEKKGAAFRVSQP